MSWIRFDKILSFLILTGLGFGAGAIFGTFRATAPDPVGPSPVVTQVDDAAPTVWTCAMHPQIRMPQPGQCPICGMTLIPIESGAAGDDPPRHLEMSAASRNLAKIETVPVRREVPETVIRMVGKVAYDETRQAHITSWVAGRIDKMYVDYTGVVVNKGDHLVYIYSPELLTAQREFIQAIEVVGKLGTGASKFMVESSKSTIRSVEEKLRLLGLTPSQIQFFKESGEIQDHVTTYAPIAGVVIEKSVQEGMYVKKGTRIYSIVDLEHVWVMLDAYEMDLAWLRYGQRVTFTAEAFVGRTFEGRISFIQPTLDEMTRTVKVRVNVENPNGVLKPGMFVRATVAARVALSGQVLDPSLEGKWIGPMHPEIVRDGPGTCPDCGMELVRAETLGFVQETPDQLQLVIPVTAPLITGERAVVYVEVPGTDRPTYEGRTIRLGARAGDVYIVEKGLAEGERVVVSGNFKIDSALQIQARPSMMNPASAPMPAHAGSHHGASGDDAVSHEDHQAAGQGESKDPVDARRSPEVQPMDGSDADHSGSHSAEGSER